MSCYRRRRVAGDAVAPVVTAPGVGSTVKAASFQCCSHQRTPDAIQSTKAQASSFLDFASIFLLNNYFAAEGRCAH